MKTLTRQQVLAGVKEAKRNKKGKMKIATIADIRLALRNARKPKTTN